MRKPYFLWRYEYHGGFTFRHRFIAPLVMVGRVRIRDHREHSYAINFPTHA